MKNGSAAAKWMDFCYDPVQAAQITQYVQYLSPVKGVRDELAKLLRFLVPSVGRRKPSADAAGR